MSATAETTTEDGTLTPGEALRLREPELLEYGKRDGGCALAVVEELERRRVNKLARRKRKGL